MEKDTGKGIKIALRYAAVTGAALLLVVVFRTVVAAANQTTVALMFLVLVLVTASRWRLACSVYASILCTLLYNFFFLPPVGRLIIADPRNWVALFAFLGSAVLVSHLAERERQHSDLSEARRRELERLYEFSQQLLLQEELRGLARGIPQLLSSCFGFEAAALYVREEDALYVSDPERSLPALVDLRMAANEAEPGVVWHDGSCVIPLLLGMRSLGVLAVTNRGFSPEVYEAMGSLTAIALERAAALERSSRLEASRESERLRSALLDSVTHDLRTPLTSIRAAATALASQPDLEGAERSELIAVVDEESARLDRLIGQAVEMAQLDADTVKVQAQPQEVREVIDAAIEELRPLLRGRAVTVEVAADLPRTAIDRTLVSRVLRHLMENAVKYSPAGSPIGIAASRDAYRLLIRLTDQGPGVAAEDQAFVFDKFFRGKNRTGKTTGTGMGLAIARAIMQAHGGGISLANQPEGGATFTIWLPLGEKNTPPGSQPEARR